MYRTKLKNNLQIRELYGSHMDVLAYFLYIYINTVVVVISRNGLS